MNSQTHSTSGNGLFFVDGLFADIDHLAEVARAWNLDFFQTGRGAFRGRLIQVGNPSFILTEAWFSHSLEQNGQTPAGLRTFAFPAHRDMNIRWRGRALTGNDIMIFPRHGELFSLSNAGFHVFTFSMEEAVLVALGETLGYPLMADFLDSGLESVRVPGQEMDALVAMCRHMVNMRHSRLGREQNADALHHPLASRLIEILVRANSTSVHHRSSPLRSAALRKIREVVTVSENHPLTVSKLCMETGTSPRTLQYAFQEEFAMSPKEWLKTRALNEARRDLRRADPARTKVADVANDWGFWHMGQFAKDYRQMFGELPSATLTH